jgi:hypothetical protein
MSTMQRNEITVANADGAPLYPMFVNINVPNRPELVLRCHDAATPGPEDPDADE